MSELVIYRGLPGSGKSTEVSRFIGGRQHPDSYEWCSADFFFWKDGKYQFDAALLIAAHAYCQIAALKAMARKTYMVIVDNTNVTRAEYALYVEMAKVFGYNVEIRDIFDGGCTDEELAARNTHGVPIDIITKMRARWEK